jgi:hypothetical protein
LENEEFTHKCQEEWGKVPDMDWNQKYQGLRRAAHGWSSSQILQQQKVNRLQDRILRFQMLHPTQQDPIIERWLMDQYEKLRKNWTCTGNINRGYSGNNMATEILPFSTRWQHSDANETTSPLLPHSKESNSKTKK